MRLCEKMFWTGFSLNFVLVSRRKGYIMPQNYDVIVVGAGHAGVEAARLRPVWVGEY